jgi:hypothetical protein
VGAASWAGSFLFGLIGGNPEKFNPLIGLEGLRFGIVLWAESGKIADARDFIFTINLAASYFHSS